METVKDYIDNSTTLPLILEWAEEIFGEYNVELQQVRDICNTFKRHGDYFPSVANYLIDIGIVDSPKFTEDKEKLCPKMLEGLITLVLWELFEKEKNNG